jgi:putative N6-adenine-specific DNA methylase
MPNPRPGIPFDECYAIVAPGAEALTAAELRALDLTPTAVEPGGVGFRAGASGLYTANLHLRTASRVVVRIATFRAATFFELERHAKRVPWDAVLSPGRGVQFHVTSRKSRLYHQRAIEQRLAAAIGTAAVEGEHEGQLFVVRVFRDVFTISADASGELLHRRGYRLASAKAPLRETLAAAMLLDSEWDGTAPLLDPMCGAGTIPIEAALIACRIAPGLGRTFAFQQWPTFDDAAWRRVEADAKTRILPHVPVPLLGSDRDAGAIDAAHQNAARAGVAEDVRFERRAISAIEPPAGPGWVVINPPYGDRIGERQRLRDLYAQLGHVLRARCAGWHVALLSAHRDLDRQTDLPLEPSLTLSNGGIRVRLMRGTVPR